ncbi:2Fe-2S iron-sulfur cluster-binding protein [Streptomyces sp. WAC 01420]|uniref:2Fe-2S iron-sulfur cluster-binding protein n=1 Tax=Streptomyces sp. WAC 01420 TaxID=2203203 RepID=UPI000F88F92C|nr:(2Fe-2S)-binding protein [Streptomyces sp. WAC 01420]RSM97263.1 hypothetical protein DMA10_11110 [Streptomyces sp. WAC 01420]
MTDDQHGEGTPPGGSRWDPLPQGDYDDGATAFVNLPEGGIDALLDSMESPLAAPGQGYVPPQITVAPATTAGTDPAATGSWAVPGAPVDGAQWHEQGGPEANAEPGDRFGYEPGATGQWNFEDTAAAGNGTAPGQDVTGQWSIPVADGDLPDESGEFTTSSLAEQWGGGSTPPATLPGGAPAPWAASESIGRPWGPGVPGVPQEPEQQGGGHGTAREQRDAATRPHGEPLPAAGERAPEPAPGHGTDQHPPYGAPGGAEAAAPPQVPARDGAAWESGPADGSAHAGPRSSGMPQPLPADDRTGAAPWHPGAEAADGASAQHREHPRPGAPQDAVRPADAPAAASGDADRAPDAPGGPPEPSTDRAEADRRAETGAPAGDGAPADDARDAATESGTPDEPDVDAGAEALPLDSPATPHDDHPLASYVLRVNGTDRPVTDAWIGESLLYVLRERLGLAGAKDGCSQGECGACNVQVDGRLVASCLVPAVTTAGSEVRTVEGLAQDGRPSDVQRALARCGAVQCGFCVPGMAMTVHDLLEGNPAPSDLETRQALCGNLCRCSGYRGVVQAVKEVVAEREAHAEDAGSDADGEGDAPRIPHQAGPGAGGVNPTAFGGPGPLEQPHDQPYGQDGGQA